MAWTWQFVSGYWKIRRWLRVKVGNSPRVTIASPDYLAAHGEPLSVEQLNAHDCIVYNLLSTRDEWHFIGPQGRETTRVHGRFRSKIAPTRFARPYWARAGLL